MDECVRCDILDEDPVAPSDASYEPRQRPAARPPLSKTDAAETLNCSVGKPSNRPCFLHTG